MDAIITLTGNLGADPRIRSVGPEQHLFTEFSIANTPRIQRDGQWHDGTTTWYRVSCWRRLAENAFHSLRRGDSVIVHGRVRTHEWADKDGVVQTRDEIEALSIGPDLNRGTVVIVRRRAAASAPTAEQPGAGAIPSGAEVPGREQSDDDEAPFAVVEQAPVDGEQRSDAPETYATDQGDEDATEAGLGAYGQAVA